MEIGEKRDHGVDLVQAGGPNGKRQHVRGGANTDGTGDRHPPENRNPGESVAEESTFRQEHICFGATAVSVWTRTKEVSSPWLEHVGGRWYTH